MKKILFTILFLISLISYSQSNYVNHRDADDVENSTSIRANSIFFHEYHGKLKGNVKVLKKYTDGNLERTFYFDKSNRITKTTDRYGYNEEYIYRDNIIIRKQFSRELTISRISTNVFDKHHNLIETEQIEFDNINKVTKQVYTYDNLGRLKKTFGYLLFDKGKNLVSEEGKYEKDSLQEQFYENRNYYYSNDEMFIYFNSFYNENKQRMDSTIVSHYKIDKITGRKLFKYYSPEIKNNRVHGMGFEYDKRYNLIKKYEVSYDESDPEPHNPYVFTVYEYDKNNNCIKETGFISKTKKPIDENDYEMTYVKERTYNKHNDMTGSTNFAPAVNHKKEINQKGIFEWEYDSKGNWIKLTQKIYFDVNRQRTTQIIKREIEYY